MSKTVREHINSLSDAELFEILRRDYFSRRQRYKITDALMQQKYGMSFNDFAQRNLVAEQNFSWEVESDAQDWEMAFDGVRTMGRRLSELTLMNFDDQNR